MFRTYRKIIALLVGGCLLLAATLSSAQGFAMFLPENMPAAVPAAATHCHDAADAQTRTAMHDHGCDEHGKKLCQGGSAACCPGFAAALPVRFPLPAVAETSLWNPLEPVLHLSTRAAGIFRPPSVSS